MPLDYSRLAAIAIYWLQDVFIIGLVSSSYLLALRTRCFPFFFSFALVPWKCEQLYEWALTFAILFPSLSLSLSSSTCAGCWARETQWGWPRLLTIFIFPAATALQRSLQQWPDRAAAQHLRFAIFAHVSVRNLWHFTPSLLSLFFPFCTLVG